MRSIPGHVQMKPEQLEIDRLPKEVAKLKAVRDILRKGRGSLPKDTAKRAAMPLRRRLRCPSAAHRSAAEHSARSRASVSRRDAGRRKALCVRAYHDLIRGCVYF